MLRKVLRFLLIVMMCGLGQSMVAPAHAQFWGGQGGGGGFFGGWFGGGPRYAPRYERAPREHQYEYSRPEPQADFSHAPPPRKETKSDVAPTTSILVMGDGMADWLAYGLEDAFADAPEISIVRKDKPNSGLLRYDVKGDLDWWHMAREIVAEQKPNYIVMMLGVTDRQTMRERDLAREAEKEQKEQEAKEQAAKEKAAKEQAAKEQAAKEQAAKDGKEPDEKKKAENGAPDEEKTAEQKPAATEEKKPKRPVITGSLEFRSEQWERIYIRRIDETIAALKSKGVPVFWVGLPAIKGTKSTADTSYLNNLYRARAQRAGIVYIDVWDGFVDDNGRYTTFGPDYEGQQRRLRSADGVYFTNYGARKLAHYVEREIRRYMSNRIVSLPSQTAAPAAPAPGKSTERPLAGPVVPLAALPANSDELIGSGGRVHGDALAAQVLVKGEPIRPQPGRADDFAWPTGNTPRPGAAAQPQSAPAKALASAPAQAGPQPKSAPAPVATAPAPPAAPAQPAPQPPVANVAPAAPEPAPPISITPQSESNLAAPEEELEGNDEPQKPAKPKRAEPKPAKPAPPRHETSAPRPPRDLQPPPQQRRASDPLGGFFGVFR